MNKSNILSSNRAHYWRYYRLVAAAVILMMAVLAGSLVLGDSVRDTLKQRVAERLGDTETIITSGTSFLSDRILQTPLLSQAHGCLLVDGFLAIDDQLIPVYVWGVDEDTIPTGSALINEPLRAKIADTQDLVLHVPSHSMVPSGSLFVTQSYATQMRLHVAGTRSVEQGGNLMLKNDQALPLNVFVSRSQLAEVMELQDKVNLILSATPITAQQLAQVWQPQFSGLHLTDSTLTSESIFIPDALVAPVLGDADVRFSYLVNDLIHHTDTVPYSFVTAVNHWQGRILADHDIILSDYAASHLHVQVGDSVRMSYFVARDLKNLDTREQLFLVREIVPLAQFESDSLLTAEFPGLTNVEKCTDWDSDLPIKMDRVHQEDEDYWNQHHQTPKALVGYEVICDDWSNAFGSATALHFRDKNQLDKHLDCSQFVTVISPRASALYAAGNGTDFASLFLALGFFIILAGVLLMQNPIVEMFAQRNAEWQLLSQLGYTQRTIRRLMFREVFGILFCASPVGLLAGVAYAGGTLWLLGNVWSGATHTEGFALHIHFTTLLLAWVLGLLICVATLCYLIRKHTRPATAPHQATATSRMLPSILSAATLFVTILLTLANFLLLHSMVLFIICGLLWIVSFGLVLRVFIDRQSALSSDHGFTRRQLLWQSICHARDRHLLAYWTLALGVFTVFAVGLNRPDFTDESLFGQATGGYQLYVDSRVPIQYDLNHPDVRRKLSLTTLPDSTRFLQFLRHTQDEASCLNLNKVATPTVLGIDLQDMAAFGLQPNTDNQSLPQVYIDQEALIWSLMKSVGDTLYYDCPGGNHTPVLIAGTYPTGIFHGNAIMSHDDFRQLWPSESGVEVLVVNTPDAQSAAQLLSTALSEYGLNIQTTAQRIQMFFTVTDTYLIIFLTLGGLGMLLGIFSLFIIVRKNLTASRPSIQLYQALGYTAESVHRMLLHENVLIPLYALLVGTLGSVISISANIGGAGLHAIMMAILCLVALCAMIYFGIKLIIKKYSL